MASIPMTVVELPLFQRLTLDESDDAEQVAVVDFIARAPEARNVIPERGCVPAGTDARQASGDAYDVEITDYH